MATASSNWTWVDPAVGGLGTYTFQVRYSSTAQGSDQISAQRTLTYELQGTPNGPPLLFEGQDQPTQMTLSGLLLYEADHVTMWNFYKLRHLTTITDDRGFIRQIYCSSFQTTRIPSVIYPWKHSYTLVALIYSMTFP